MAGIFGFFDYTKPGKGIDKDAPEKHPFFLFFELLWRKKGQLLLLNLIYFAALLPLIAAGYYIFYYYIINMLEGAGMDAAEYMANILPNMLLSAAFSLPPWLSVALLCLSAVLYGPATCGMAYMMRNFARQEKAWNSDFFDKFRQNFKQGLALGLADLAVLSLLVFNLSLQSGDGGDVLYLLIRYLSLLFLLVYLFMRNYFFVMTVTFSLKLAQIVKNAFIFSVLGLWKNILVLIVNGALFLLTLGLLPELAELFVVPLLLFSLTGFVSVFATYPLVKKHMIDPQAEVKAV
jgi:uncharacterized membrane protein YesL